LHAILVGFTSALACNLLIPREGHYRLHAVLPRTASNSDTQTGRLALALRELILQGQFSPSERLTELGLASRLNASRTPVRLALERLASEGLLDAIPSGGFRIRSFSLADIRDAIEIRGVLEGTAARFAAERFGGPDELLQIKELCSQTVIEMPLTPQSFAQYLETNKKFHRELWRLAKSPSLFRELEHACKIPFAAPEALVFGVVELQEVTASAYVAAYHHRTIVEAIQNREGARAEVLAREHSRVSRRNLELAFEAKQAISHSPGLSLVINR
jgi:GntR family transcriptional regulator, vanillate catabolism transcriptional regulator